MSENVSNSWMPIGKAAKYIGVSIDTLRRWEKRGKIKSVRSPTNRRYYTQKLLDEIKNGGQSTSPLVRPETKKAKAKLPPKAWPIILGVVSFLVAIAIAFLVIGRF